MIEDDTHDGRATETVEPTSDPSEGPRPTATSGPRPNRLPWIVATVAVLVAVAIAITAALLVRDARQPAADLEAVESAAGAFALELTSWDATDGMSDTREALREAGTETFASDVDQLFGGTDDLATLEELGARSEGTIDDVFVQSLDGDEAEALAVVVQRVSTDVTEGEEVSLRYARLTLQRQDGTWHIDGVELLVDALQQAADRSDLSELSEDAPPADDGDAPTDDAEQETP